MAITNGTYVPFSNLVMLADPGNSRCYSGFGTTAYNLINQSSANAFTLSSIGYNSGVWTNAAAGVVQSPTVGLALSSGFTVVQWLNLTTTAGGTFSYTSGSNAINMYMGGSTRMRWETYLTGGDLTGNQVLPTSTWFMIAGSFSGTGSAGGSGTSKIYYNGNLDNSGTLAGTASNSAAFQIGLHSGPMNGSIGITAFWARALSDQEIRTVFNSYRKRYGI